MHRSSDRIDTAASVQRVVQRVEQEVDPRAVQGGLDFDDVGDTWPRTPEVERGAHYDEIDPRGFVP